MQLFVIFFLVVLGAFAVVSPDFAPQNREAEPAAISPVATTTLKSVEKPVVVPKKQPSEAKEKKVASTTPKQNLTAEPVKKSETPKPPSGPITINLSELDQFGETSSVRFEIPVADLELRIHELINKERVALGFTPLAWQPGLLAIARGHSEDMATRGYFAHNSPEGENFSGRYARGGFTCEIRIENTIYLGGENLFKNNFYDSWEEVNGVRTYKWNSLERVAATTVHGWMQSPGHRANLLKPYWRGEAIGIFYSTDDRIYITQNFC